MFERMPNCCLSSAEAVPVQHAYPESPGPGVCVSALPPDHTTDHPASHAYQQEKQGQCSSGQCSSPTVLVLGYIKK